MPNGFDFDFKEVYGHEFDEMSRTEKDMATLSQLYYLRKEQKEQAETVKTCIDAQGEQKKIIDRHNLYFSIITLASSAALLALIGVGISKLFGT